MANRLRRLIGSSLCALVLACSPGCENDSKGDTLIDGPGKPQIEVTGISSYQESDQGNNIIRCKVSHVKPSEYKVAVYLSVFGPSANDATHAWWPKPAFGNTFTEINDDGTCKTDFNWGGMDRMARFFRVFLVPASIPDPYEIDGYYWAGKDIPSGITGTAVDVVDYDRGRNY